MYSELLFTNSPRHLGLSTTSRFTGKECWKLSKQNLKLQAGHNSLVYLLTNI